VEAGAAAGERDIQVMNDWCCAQVMINACKASLAASRSRSSPTMSLPVLCARGERLAMAKQLPWVDAIPILERWRFEYAPAVPTRGLAE